METTEQIVESWCRYIQHWFTISNIKCEGKNKEVDILALGVDKANRIQKYHIEVSISVSNAFSKLNDKKFTEDELKHRTKQAGLRRSIRFFIQKKFEAREVLEKLEKYGFTPNHYKKMIVSWGWTESAKKIADNNGIELKDFRDVLKEIRDACNSTTYFKDDTLRTIQLFEKALKETEKSNGPQRRK